MLHKLLIQKLKLDVRRNVPHHADDKEKTVWPKMFSKAISLSQDQNPWDLKIRANSLLRFVLLFWYIYLCTWYSNILKGNIRKFQLPCWDKHSKTLFLALGTFAFCACEQISSLYMGMFVELCVWARARWPSQEKQKMREYQMNEMWKGGICLWFSMGKPILCAERISVS